MYKNLLIVLILLFAFVNFLVTADPALASTHAYTSQKKFYGFWRLLTLKELLVVQTNTVSSPTPSPTNKPTPTPLAQTTRIATPTSAQKQTPSTSSGPTATPRPTISQAQSTPTTSQPTATATPQPTTPPAPVTDVTSYIMNEINKYRASLGLSAVHTNDETCNFAKTRAQEISTSFTHDGFNNRSSNHTLPYSHWTKITENIAMTSNYKDVETMWQNSSGHAENMRADTTYVCVMQYGNYYAYEGMKP